MSLWFIFILKWSFNITAMQNTKTKNTNKHCNSKFMTTYMYSIYVVNLVVNVNKHLEATHMLLSIVFTWYMHILHLPALVIIMIMACEKYNVVNKYSMVSILCVY